MKKIIVLMLAAVMLLTVLSGCKEQPRDTEKLQIVCTVFPQYDFVRNIAKDRADVKMLVPLGTESHDFQLENLTVAELKTVATADLVVYIGGESDGEWIDELRKTVKDDGTRWLALTDTVETLEEISSESMRDTHDLEHSHDHGHGEKHEHTAYDEHVWTSPKSAVKITAAVTDVLCEIDPENAAEYRSNCDGYTAQLKALDEKLTAAVSGADTKKLIFGDRFPFRYLCADYGLGFDAAFPGCSAGVDPTVAQMMSLTKSALESGAKVIFYMENSDPVFAESIAKTVGGKAELLHSCHTFSKEELDAGVDYVSVMNENIEKIAEALK